jgi:hypothetical protein
METRCGSLVMLRDSLTTIKAINGDSIEGNSNIYIFLDRAREEAKTLAEISFFHVTRDFNRETDHWDKRASSLNLGQYIQNGEGSKFIIP